MFHSLETIIEDIEQFEQIKVNPSLFEELKLREGVSFTNLYSEAFAPTGPLSGEKRNDIFLHKRLMNFLEATVLPPLDTVPTEDKVIWVFVKSTEEENEYKLLLSTNDVKDVNKRLENDSVYHSVLIVDTKARARRFFSKNVSVH